MHATSYGVFVVRRASSERRSAGGQAVDSGVEPPLLRARGVLAHERDPTRRDVWARIGGRTDGHDVEDLLEGAGLGRSGALPEVVGEGAKEDGPVGRPEDDQGLRLDEGDPVEEGR